MSNNVNYLISHITSKYGFIQRARGCFLYTKKGVRLTDMYQEGGRAILGWGGTSSFTMFKNVMNRGLTGSFQTEQDYKVCKAMSELLDSRREVFYFSSKAEALKASLQISQEGTSVYKPWMNESIKWGDIDCVIFEPTLSWTNDIFMLCVKTSITDNFTDEERDVLQSHKVNASFKAGIARSIYNLISELKERKETHWFKYDSVLTKYFTRKGPYLYPKMSEDKYKSFIDHCLDCEIVISPIYTVPSIVPYGVDVGVFTKLKNNEFKY